MNWFKKFWKEIREPAPQKNSIHPVPRASATGEGLGTFTPRAMQVLALANKEAGRFNHNFIGTEHLLLGLIALGQGCAVNVLGKIGLDLETVRMEVEKQIPKGPEPQLNESPPYTPRLKKALALADKERRKLNHTYLGTEHILLGLLLEGDGVAAKMLKNLGVDIEKTRQEILQELDPVFARQSDGEKNLNAQEHTIMSSPNSIDTSKRYDVYCVEHGQEIVVYRNALFKGIKRLYEARQYDFSSDFIEMEQANGRIIYLVRTSVIKFCEHGITPEAEKLPPQKLG